MKIYCVGNWNDDISSEEHFEDSKFLFILRTIHFCPHISILSRGPVSLIKIRIAKRQPLLYASSFFFAEREAGFYTTRFGRADPLMRIQELQARLHSHQQHADPGSLIQASFMKCPCSKCPEMEFLNGIFSRGFWAKNSSLVIYPHFSILQNAIHD
jgi:hypothetical protein